jgi:hypothetical protein
MGFYATDLVVSKHGGFVACDGNRMDGREIEYEVCDPWFLAKHCILVFAVLCGLDESHEHWSSEIASLVVGACSICDSLRFLGVWRFAA